MSSSEVSFLTALVAVTSTIAWFLFGSLAALVIALVAAACFVWNRPWNRSL